MNVFCVVAGIVALQGQQVVVTGTVRDAQSGAPLVAAMVRIGEQARFAITDRDGRYALPVMGPGPRHLTVERLGYEARTVHALVPLTGSLEINLLVRPAPIPLDTLVARPHTATAGHDDVLRESMDRRLDGSRAEHHPLLAEPDGLIALAGGDVVMAPESPAGLHVRGGAADQTAHVIDGVPVYSAYHAAGIASALNADAFSHISLAMDHPTPELPGALSGVVVAATRPPGTRLRGRGHLSTTQAGVVMDGPLVGGAGYLLSVRSGFPGGIGVGEASYIRGATSDVLVRIDVPLAGGRVRLLGYGNDNELNTAADAEGSGASEAERNGFGWRSRSVGLTWVRPLGTLTLEVLGWNAHGDAFARWHAQPESPTTLASERSNAGLRALIERNGARSWTRAGVRAETDRTTYRVALDASRPAVQRQHVPIATMFVRHAQELGGGVSIDASLSIVHGAHRTRAGPSAFVAWQALEDVRFDLSYSRRFQFAQSLRNAESVVGAVFPADLFVASGAALPVARVDQVGLGLEVHPAPGLQASVQAYAREFDGLALVALGETQPFALDDVVVGNGRAAGIALELAMAGARHDVLVRYGLQHVRWSGSGARYTPAHGVAHNLESGVTLHVTPTFSLRLGASAALGRRTSAAVGGLEYESCNLVDLGCEFGGSPQHTEPPGSRAVPAYVRLDAGVRKHWHVRVAGRDARIALFGTVTNLAGRTNVLTWTVDPVTGVASPIEMRPRSPLVIGLDWQF